MSTVPPHGRFMLGAAEVSLTALTCAAGAGLVRLFADASLVPQVLVVAATAHVLAAVCRRRGLGIGLTLVISSTALAFVVSWLVLGDTTAFGIPTGETLRVAREDLSDAWATFGDVKAPAPTLPGFVLASAIGVWGIGTLADTAAFRSTGVFEAMVPPATLFVFGAALGAPRYRLPVTVVFVAALLAYWLCARALRQLSSPSWMARDERRGTQAVLRTGTWVGAAGVLASMLIGPNLPGAEAEAVIPWRASDRDDGGSRVTVSPLVDIRTRIVDQASVKVFSVKSPVRSYWRLTALETFDGRIWSSSRRYRKAEGRLGSAVSEDNLPTETVEQSYEITALDSIWLPAAFRPVGIDGTGARYDAESASLLTEAATAIGARYTVASALPRLDSSLLAAAPAEIPQEIATTYLALPPEFPANVRSLAAGVVQGSQTMYEASRRLQDFLRGPEFTYDLNVPPGHGDDALERFLFETRRGYCEQFAGAYAAMARAVGIPSRIGVGFTTGELGPDGAYSVHGYHGHAWPEVYLAGFGWVAFEPTPGRGIPGGESYTGVPEQQATPSDPQTATTLATTTTVAPVPGGATTTIPNPDLPDTGAGTGDEHDNPWPRRLLIAAAIVVGLPVLWVSTVVTAGRLRRQRRRARAASGHERVAIAWEELGEALARRGVPALRSETPTEYAHRAARAAKLDPVSLRELADLTTIGRYAPPAEASIDDERLESALETARNLEREVIRHLDGKTRMRALVDPRVPAGR